MGRSYVFEFANVSARLLWPENVVHKIGIGTAIDILAGAIGDASLNHFWKQAPLGILDIGLWIFLLGRTWPAWMRGCQNLFQAWPVKTEE